MCNHVFKPLWYVCDDDYGITTNKIHLENDNKGHLAYCTKCGQVFVREIAEKMWVCEVKKMSDLISRQAAIDELKRISFSRWFECGEYLTEDTREIEIINSNKALEVIEALPSVELGRKNGKWIKDGHHIQCNQCGISICDKDREGDALPKKFCPNCGSYNGGEEDE